MAKSKNNISDKQERFCQEYLIDLNGTQAAIRAGYSPKTANEQSSQLLAKLNIKDYIQKLKSKVSDKLEITREIILEGYRKLAFYDARKFYDENGDLLKVPDLDDETAFALTGFEVMEEKAGFVTTGYTKKIKMSDRKGAMDSISKVLGYFAPDKVAQTDTEGNDIEKPYSRAEILDFLNQANG